METIMRWLAALAAALTAGLAHAGQYSDLWYFPQESGWGLNVVQQDENAFVTLFVYGPDRRPTWYVSSDARITAYAGTQPLFRGTLYRTEGSPVGQPHSPVSVHPVGEIYLETLSRTSMRVHYRIGGVEHVKQVVRQTFAETPLTANYLAHFHLRQSLPGGPPYGTSTYHGEMLLHVDAEAGVATLRVTDHLSRQCEYRGPYEQTGKLFHFAGGFTCSGGDALGGTFQVTDLEASAHGITAALRTVSGNVVQNGRFAAVRW